jgi:Spy/CpxP family protein refolding chaperone
MEGNMKSRMAGRILKHTILFFLIITLFFTGTTMMARASTAFTPDLTDEQIKSIETIIDKYYQLELEIIYQMEHKGLALYHELQREDAFADEEQAAQATRTFKSLVKDLSNLEAQLLRTQTEYFLSIKHVLTDEQKKRLINSLNVELEPQDSIYIYYEVNIENILGTFTPEQSKKIVHIQHDLEVKMARINKELDLVEIDFRLELLAKDPDSKKIKEIVGEVTELNIELMGTVVDATLQFKDVLTIEQKKKLRHYILTAVSPDLN